MPNPSHLLAVDIGGTFTDIVLFDTESNHIAVGKVLTTYPDPSQAVLSGVTQLLKDHNIDPASVRQVIHGTTLVTNTLIERKGAHTALIATEGFRDALEMAIEMEQEHGKKETAQPRARIQGASGDRRVER